MRDELTDCRALALAAADIVDLGEHAAARVVIGIAGPPGTGKSTFAELLVDRLEADRPGVAAMLPMDGFHLSNRQLARLGLRDRKGAPDTFDVDGYVSVLRRAARSSGDVFVPGFDRVLDEAVAAALVVPAGARVVITEGNYLALADGGWKPVRAEIDRLYYLDCAAQVRRDRLIARHVAGGLSRIDAERWVDSVDEPNAALIARTEGLCDRTLFVRAG